MGIFKDPISEAIWDIKYRYRQGERIGDQTVVDQTIEATWQRVAKAIAHAEKKAERSHWQKAFYRILEGFRFLPGGRVLAGAGTKHKVTLFNCFVMDIDKDSLSGIFTGLEEGALTLQQGGGVGYDFSVLRPSGDPVKKTSVSASGPVSFMRIWDTMCSVMQSTGARRGAMMGVLRCDHPDIETFVTAKRDPHELRHFNVSVMVSDAFMEAVKNNADWPLIFPTTDAHEGEIIYRQWGNEREPVPCRVYRHIKARELWNNIIRSAYDCAEPGVLFGDTINRMNNLRYREQINATNPCGEIPLPPFGACDLGAINLTQFVVAPFSNYAKLDWDQIIETVRIATRFLDNVIDVSRYPLRVQRQQALGTRRIGLGITGLADMFVMLGIRYGSPESVVLARDIMHRIAEATWRASIELAQEKKPFPFFTQDYLQGEFVAHLSEALRYELGQYGVRNSHHNTIAPTGTTSLLANNVSNGIEPIFHANYDRHVRSFHSFNSSKEEVITFRVQDYAYALWLSEKRKEALPPAWMDAHSLSPEAHLDIQGAMQPYIDNAISKTINIPEHFPFEKLTDIYTKAYALGLKGCTVFRPNPVTGNVLEVNQAETIAVDQCCQHD